MRIDCAKSKTLNPGQVPGKSTKGGRYSGRLSRLNHYLPVFTYWMQSPWFLKVLPSARVKLCQPPFLH